MFEILCHSPIFWGLTPIEIQDILRGVPNQVRSFKKGDMVVQSEETCSQLLVLIEGQVKGEMVDYSGKTLKIEDIAAPRPLAPAFLFGNQNKYPVNIISSTESKILFIPVDSFLAIMQANVKVLQNYLNVISNRSQFLSRKIQFLSFKTIKGKVAQLVLDLSKVQGMTVRLGQTQQELADFFGVTRPSLARALGEMEKEGLIEIHRKEIQIVNKEKMFLLIQLFIRSI